MIKCGICGEELRKDGDEKCSSYISYECNCVYKNIEILDNFIKLHDGEIFKYSLGHRIDGFIYEIYSNKRDCKTSLIGVECEGDGEYWSLIYELNKYMDIGLESCAEDSLKLIRQILKLGLFI
jgi:hypothetical protein